MKKLLLTASANSPIFSIALALASAVLSYVYLIKYAAILRSLKRIILITDATYCYRICLQFCNRKQILKGLLYKPETALSIQLSCRLLNSSTKPYSIALLASLQSSMFIMFTRFLSIFTDSQTM